jgi:predicted DNA-binding transcriptional regulator AlpA
MAAVNKEVIRERIAAFSAYPDDALIDPHTVAGLFSCSVETIKRRVRAQQFPSPLALTANTHRWRAGDVRRELAKLAAAKRV